MNINEHIHSLMTITQHEITQDRWVYLQTVRSGCLCRVHQVLSAIFAEEDRFAKDCHTARDSSVLCPLCEL